MNNSESRRKLLKSLATGSGAIVAGKNLPESWGRPIVDSVILPVHAQTSGPLGPFNYHYTENGTVEVGALLSPEPNSQLFASIIDGLLPSANAQDDNITIDVCIDYGYEDKPDKWRAAIRVIALVDFGPYSAGDLVSMHLAEGGTVGGPAVTMTGRICCGAPNPATSMKVYTADGIEADFAVSQDGMDELFERTAPIGACPFGDPDDETCGACGGGGG